MDVFINVQLNNKHTVRVDQIKCHYKNALQACL